MFSDLFSRCYKSGRIRGINLKAWPKWSIGIAGLIAVVWYLIRVIPKPSRAAYPCMTATTPIRLGFIVWVISLLFSVFSLRKARTLFGRARYFYGTVFLTLSAVSLLVFISSSARDASAAFIGLAPRGANQPIGVARGIFPGRVAWVHNPNAGNWTGSGNWWADAVNNQGEYDKMIPQAVRSLSGGTSEADAWDRIFKWFNQSQGRGALGYRTGERIAIKINQNNITTHGDNNNSNGNPHLILALLKSLVNGAGVPQNMITVSDPSRAISNAIFNKCDAVFPDVVYEDHLGGRGRVKATYVTNAIPYSVDNGTLARGIASSFVNARYVINMALLKGHSGTGITFGAKNFYGATSISSNTANNRHTNFSPSPTGANKYMTFTDFMGHKDLGEKTILWLMDAIYPNQHLGGTPGGGWSMAPFNGSRPSSIFASLDGVANESVSLDFFLANWPNAVKLEYCDQYMHEAALANAPPSGTFYDPEKDGSRLRSLGVHEHWNNPVSKQYSRNLGTGQGIELIRVHEGGTIPNRPPIVSFTRPNNGASFTAPASITVTAVASDPDGTVNRVVLENNGSPVGTDRQAPWEWTISNLGQGDYTLKVTAYDNDGASSSASVSFTVNARPAAQIPACNPAAGSFESAVSVSLSSATPGAEIRYTTDGSSPTASSSLYGGAVELAMTTVLKAMTFKAEFAPSPVMTAVFYIGKQHDAFIQREGDDGIVIIEAEHFYNNIPRSGHEWQPQKGSDYSGGRAMASLPNSGVNISADNSSTSPRLDFLVDFAKTGTHYIWARGTGASSEDDSFNMGIDGQVPATADRFSGFSGSLQWSGRDMDGNRITIDVQQAGPHLVHAWMREDGFVLDKLILTVDPDFVPADAGPLESIRQNVDIPAPVLTVAAAPDSGEAALTVSFSAERTGGSVLGLFWDFGDGNENIPGGLSAEHSYDTPGTYEAVLTAYGIRDTVSRKVQVVVTETPVGMNGDGIESVSAALAQSVLRYRLPAGSHRVSVELYSLQGKKLYSYAESYRDPGIHLLDLNKVFSFPAGNYMLIFRTAGYVRQFGWHKTR